MEKCPIFSQKFHGKKRQIFGHKMSFGPKMSTKRKYVNMLVRYKMSCKSQKIIFMQLAVTRYGG